MDDAALLTSPPTSPAGRGRDPGDPRARLRHLRKSDAAPVTEADHAAEALIVAGAARATPDIPVVAEEEIAAGHVPPSPTSTGWSIRWTARASSPPGATISRSVSAWCATGAPVLGVVGVPAPGEVFGGIVGAGRLEAQDGAGERAIPRRACRRGRADVLACRGYADDARMVPFLRGRPVASGANAAPR